MLRIQVDIKLFDIWGRKDKVPYDVLESNILN